jgi:hypothetical protein
LRPDPTITHEWSHISSAYTGLFQWCVRCGCVRQDRNGDSVRYFEPGLHMRTPNLNEGGSTEAPPCCFRKPASLLT